MTELNKAYASNTQTPLHTLEFSHSGISGGVLRLVQAYQDLSVTLEDATSAVFTAAGFGLSLPEKTTDGRQDLLIQLDNVSSEAYTAISAAKTASRVTEEKIVCKYRPYLESDLSAPAGAVITLSVIKSVVTRNRVSLTASYTPIPEINWPRLRYTPDIFPGIRYA